MNEKNKSNNPIEILDAGPFYHGTKAILNEGDFLTPGFNSNYGKRKTANFVYFTATMDAAIWGAELAAGSGRGHIYQVVPMGIFDNDPNLTDKKFPGNPTRSYRTKQALKIICEVSDWENHSEEVLQQMKSALQSLNDQGIEAIND